MPPDSSSPGAALLQAHGVSVTYGNRVPALHPTTLDFRAGAFTVLLGASGAGKSTLLRTLNGLVAPTAGRLQVEGIGPLDSRAALHRHRRQTGMVFQQHHLIGRASVLANVLLGRLGRHRTLATLWPWSREEKRLALAAIDRVGLLSHALQRADQLSGGQQQRVGIARALVQQPRLLLADEPVASLDPVTALDLLALLHGICKSDGLTAIVSLHQLELARRFADRIVALKNGSVVFDGAPQQLTEGRAQAIYSRDAAGMPPAAAAPVPPRFDQPLGATA